MNRSPAARPYARALFELAREQGRLDAVHADLLELARLLEQESDYQALLDRHQLSPENRKDLWRELLEGHADPLTLRFIYLLVDKQRGRQLGDIIQAFTLLYREAQGITTLDIIAAHPLTDAQVQALVERFSKKIGGRIQATQKVDPALLGGFQVRVGDVVYDYSVNHQLESLQLKLATA